MAKAPEKTIRLGSVSASIFVNEVGEGDQSREIRNVNLQRRYKDGDVWRNSSSFGLADLPTAIRAIQLAQSHVEAMEADV